MAIDNDKYTYVFTNIRADENFKTCSLQMLRFADMFNRVNYEHNAANLFMQSGGNYALKNKLDHILSEMSANDKSALNSSGIISQRFG